MGNLNLKITTASSVLFTLSIVLLICSTIIDNDLVFFITVRVAVFTALLSAFYGLYAIKYNQYTLKTIWEEKNQMDRKETSITDEIWLFQPLIFTGISLVLFVFHNPYLS